ncbi:hypothetical protein [Streptomyces demainii]|uniref:Uncharacterized protein n=1 Tax=Streptomyces demainii TaxID=588122 RepID=A0ABT9L6S5_9ACTN|nr:hypothetical protein [Streptomyces demainii]MDP9616419.1 hypothetical protein [Streptomyces demainii]
MEHRTDQERGKQLAALVVAHTSTGQAGRSWMPVRIVRTDTLQALRAELEQMRDQLAAARHEAELATDSAIRAETTAERLHEDLLRVTADAARDAGELEILRAQTLLDTEDRATLRILLRTVRKQSPSANRVYALFRRGELHSIHASMEAAEAAAEAEGAPRSGWTSHTAGAALPPAREVEWRVQPLPLGGTR